MHSSESPFATPTKLRAELLLAAVAFSWAAGFVLMKSALTDNSVWVVLWLRFTLAALLIAPLCVRATGWRVATAARGVGLGVLLFGSFALLISGLQLTTATNTGVLTGLSVVWVPLVGWLMLGQGVRVEVLVGLSLCLGGIVVLSGGRITALGMGDVLVIGGSLLTALHILGVDRWSREHHAATLTLLQLAVVALMSLAIGWADGSVWPDAFNTELVLCLGVTALLSTAFAFWVQTRFQRATTPARAAMIFNLEPVFSALLAFSFLGERQGAHVFIACALIVAGMCATEMRFTRAPAGSR